MPKKIVVVSDFSSKGSGYANIVVPICKELANRGHQIMAVGLSYEGEEHNFSFSIIPCNSFTNAQAMANNLHFQWNADIYIVALDIPYLSRFIEVAKRVNKKIIVITPLENPPLTASWAILLQQADKIMFISELGKVEAIAAGIDEKMVEHLLVGIDCLSWRRRETEEYEQGRKMLAIPTDTLVILTVADNQERKNLSKSMEIVSKVKKMGKNVRYILVTREHSEVGWKLRDLAFDLGIASDVMIFERGMPFKELYALYAISDVFLLTSKAEGLGMPIMEAMAVGVPVVASSCGAIPELLGNGERGFLIKTEYSTIDPWGNERRDFPDASHGAEILFNLNSKNNQSIIENARRYIELRNPQKLADQIESALEEVLNEEKAQ